MRADAVATTNDNSVMSVIFHSVIETVLPLNRITSIRSSNRKYLLLGVAKCDNHILYVSLKGKKHKEGCL